MGRKRVRSASSRGTIPAEQALADERRSDAEGRDPLCLGHPPQRAEIGMAGTAVVGDDRRSHEQATEQVVPHHPAGRGEPEERVAGAEIVVQHLLLEVLQHDAALAVHDRLGAPGRPGRVDDPQRRVEGHPLERQLAGFAEELGPIHGVGHGSSAAPPARSGRRRSRPDSAARRAEWRASPKRRGRGRCSGSRRSRRAPSARSAGSGRGCPPGRNPASTTTRSRRGSRWPGMR